MGDGERLSEKYVTGEKEMNWHSETTLSDYMLWHTFVFQLECETQPIPLWRTVSKAIGESSERVSPGNQWLHEKTKIKGTKGYLKDITKCIN